MGGRSEEAVPEKIDLGCIDIRYCACIRPDETADLENLLVRGLDTTRLQMNDAEAKELGLKAAGMKIVWLNIKFIKEKNIPFKVCSDGNHIVDMHKAIAQWCTLPEWKRHAALLDQGPNDVHKTETRWKYELRSYPPGDSVGVLIAGTT